MKIFIYILLAIAALYVLIGFGLYLFQRDFLYFPTPEVNASGAQAIYLDQDGLRLKIWKVDVKSSKAIIYFGGNAEPVSRNIAPLRSAAPGWDIYLLNYRGYGGSEGSPSEAALYADAKALYDLIKDDYDQTAVIGRSLGSGVATHLASERPIGRVALITPYDSITNVAQGKFALYPVSLLLKDKYNSAANAARIDVPVLILLAENDGVIPRRHSDILASEFPTDPKIIIIPATDHLSVSQPGLFWTALGEFLAE